MIRRNFIRDTLLACAFALVPKTLLPVTSEIEVEEDYTVTIQWHYYDASGTYTEGGQSQIKLNPIFYKEWMEKINNSYDTD